MTLHVRTLPLVLITVVGCVGCARQDSVLHARTGLSRVYRALKTYHSQLGLLPPTIK